MPFRNAFKSLFADAEGVADPLRAAARAVLQVALVMLGFLLFTRIVQAEMLTRLGDSDAVRTGLLTLTGLVYGGLHVFATSRHRAKPAIGSSVALLVLELSLLSLMLPFLVHQAQLLVPRHVLQALARPESLGLELLVFVCVVLFALRGWARHAARAAQTARAEAAASVYERMAMEDGLTGLANRRRFETCIADWLP